MQSSCSKSRYNRSVVLLGLLLWLLPSLRLTAQEEHPLPDDPLVLQKLANWQDLKFGLLMHWGPYSQWGVVESWSICPEDEDWTQRKGPYSKTYEGYRQAYEQLQSTFNPTAFNPEKWAQAASDAGMKYVIFTTKHHDGFAMFDTKQSDYKITDPKTPFSKNPRANVTKEIFNAFRKEHFMTGAYFSKPDWHSPYYWWPYFPPKNRHVNYDPVKYPERWQQFKSYTHKQVDELMSDYGPVDILWLDGGWVRPLTAEDTAQKRQRFNQDIDMAGLAAMARKKQPGLIVVDRSVAGIYENYTTPEQEVPEAPLPYLWETCMTMGNSWSYVPGDQYKPVSQLVQLLIKVVSRGGNFLLNIGPDATGDWDPVAYERLKGIGDWMHINSEGIYNSRPVRPYSSGNLFYTQNKTAHRLYVFMLADTNGLHMPASLTVPLANKEQVRQVRLLGCTEKLHWTQDEQGLHLTETNRLHLASLQHALCFAIDYQ